MTDTTSRYEIRTAYVTKPANKWRARSVAVRAILYDRQADWYDGMASAIASDCDYTDTTDMTALRRDCEENAVWRLRDLLRPGATYHIPGIVSVPVVQCGRVSEERFYAATAWSPRAGRRAPEKGRT